MAKRRQAAQVRQDLARVTPAERQRRQRSKAKDSRPSTLIEAIANSNLLIFERFEPLLRTIHQLLNDADVADAEPDRRKGATHFTRSIYIAIGNLAENMRDLGFPREKSFYDTARHLNAALLDLDKGIVDPILRPAAEKRSDIVLAEVIRGVRPRLPTNVLVDRLVVAMLMQFELELDTDKKRGRVRRAAQTTAAALKTYRLGTVSRDVDWRTIQRWRSDFAESWYDPDWRAQLELLLQNVGL